MTMTQRTKKEANGDASSKVHSATISPKQEANEDQDEDGTVMLNGNDDDEPAEDADFADNDDAGWDDNDDGVGFDNIDPSKLKKVQEAQALVDELKTW
eukprot:CAMPEP_0201594660 /NCGR_PEP_ID=MMETSP0190_2-20130828/191910_1 /ASSEMBLY_ACC=CAM_ASM_000263 /TAXON_ID=37353 /ORGANISM="Rosalina sp." /LENGTH=97 /DNA_ID=CAMNT_0048054361 /DNA_START=409 /DNA_END=699 /DNA_ORIENTATION=+